MRAREFLNNRISEHLLLSLSQCGIKTHLIKTQYEGTVNKKSRDNSCRNNCQNLATGSLTKRLGITEGTILSKPLIEYCYKSDDLGDPLVSIDHIFEFNWADKGN